MTDCSVSRSLYGIVTLLIFEGALSLPDRSKVLTT